MKKILLILTLLISFNSFAQDDDWFWSYRHPQLYDTIFITGGSDFTIARFRTYSGDSLTISSASGIIKVPGTGVNTTATYGIYGSVSSIISKHNDLYDFELLYAGGATFINTSQAKLLKTIEITDAVMTPNFTLNKALENFYINSSTAGTSTTLLDFSNNNLLKTFTSNYEPITTISLTDNHLLTSINTAYCENLTTVNLGNPNSNVINYYGFGCAYNQANIDKILKWLVDGGNEPNLTGVIAGVNLCGGTSATPSSTGMDYVSILTSRGWNVCVKSSTTLPVVQTNSTTNISRNSATGNGSVTNEGRSSATARGVCWSTSINPTISGSHTTDGSGIGYFTSNITGLSANTTYHVRAYATNSLGTSYGADLTFTTLNDQTQPELITKTTQDISENSATSGGVITSNGGYEIIEKGVCWSTSSSPTTLNSHTNDGNGISEFTSNITGLDENTTYYVRSYAKNRRDNGGTWVYFTGYGQEEIFTTSSTSSCNLPNVTTNPITLLYATSAYGGGNVTSDGGCPVTKKGICYSTSPNPTIANSHTTDGSGTGSFVSNMTGLICETTYYARAYATNSAGTAYGSEVSFTTTSVHLTNYTFNYYLTSANCGSRNFTASLLDAQDACSDLANSSCTTSPGDGMSGQIFQVEAISVGKKIYVYNSACTVATSITGYYIVGSQIVHVMAGEIVGIYTC